MHGIAMATVTHISPAAWACTSISHRRLLWTVLRAPPAAATQQRQQQQRRHLLTYSMISAPLNLWNGAYM